MTYYQQAGRTQEQMETAQKNGLSPVGLDPKGVEMLRMAIVKKAYEDLLNAWIVDAIIRFHHCSYNCHIEYEAFREKKTIARDLFSSGTHLKTLTEKQCRQEALRQIKILEKWFLESERCRDLLDNSKPEWFVEMAKKKCRRFVEDRIMKADLAVNIGQSFDKARYERKLREWKAERDKWREANGLKGVED